MRRINHIKKSRQPRPKKTIPFGMMDEMSCHAPMVSGMASSVLGLPVKVTQFVVKRNSGKKVRFGSLLYSGVTGERLDGYVRPKKFLPTQAIRKVLLSNCSTRVVLILNEKRVRYPVENPPEYRVSLVTSGPWISR